MKMGNQPLHKSKAITDDPSGGSGSDHAGGDALREALESFIAAADKFIAKVESGRARSMETYGDLSEARKRGLAALAAPSPTPHEFPQMIDRFERRILNVPPDLDPDRVPTPTPGATLEEPARCAAFVMSDTAVRCSVSGAYPVALSDGAVVRLCGHHAKMFLRSPAPPTLAAVPAPHPRSREGELARWNARPAPGAPPKEEPPNG